MIAKNTHGKVYQGRSLHYGRLFCSCGNSEEICHDERITSFQCPICGLEYEEDEDGDLICLDEEDG